MESENPEAGPGRLKAHQKGRPSQLEGQPRSLQERGAEAGAGCGLERGLLPEGTRGVCVWGETSWSRLLVGKERPGPSPVAGTEKEKG